MLLHQLLFTAVTYNTTVLEGKQLGYGVSSDSVLKDIVFQKVYRVVQGK